MYKLLPLAVLGLASVAANAAGSYALTFVYAYNPFSPLGTSVLIGSVPTSGTASVDGAGNVSASGISHSFTNVSSAYNYTNGTWSAVVGGTAVTHSEICTETAGLPCTGLLSGLTGIWNNSQTNGGAASSICSASTFFPAGNCDAVSIVEDAGVSLTIIEQSEFAIPGLPAGFIYRFGPPLGPLFCANRYEQVVQNTSTTIVTPAACTNFANPVMLSVVTPPTHGSASLSGGNIIYTPTGGFFGTDTLTYQGTDGATTDDATVNITVLPDTDGDGVRDDSDNCTLVKNADQLDANSDGFGNICDGDINNSGLVTTADFALLRAVLGQAASASATAAAADMNGSGLVTTADFGLLRARLGTAPGPRGSLP